MMTVAKFGEWMRDLDAQAEDGRRKFSAIIEKYKDADEDIQWLIEQARILHGIQWKEGKK